MITLYNSDAITKICNLDDCLECLVTEEENGVFELELTYNISSSNFSYIQNNNVIKTTIKILLLYIFFSKFQIYILNTLVVCIIYTPKVNVDTVEINFSVFTFILLNPITKKILHNKTNIDV